MELPRQVVVQIPGPGLVIYRLHLLVTGSPFAGVAKVDEFLSSEPAPLCGPRNAVETEPICRRRADT